ncbi:hypothetical protein ACFLYX_02185 [Chloroflexota bacterium]
MIEYDYILKRDENDELRTFLPGKIGKKLPNLVYIEGPNSSGKSTLLHILALSFHGLKNENIKPSLLEKIDNLINSDHQNISFKIDITDKDGNLELSSAKDIQQNDIVLRDASKNIVNVDNFKKKYNLIYDIPEDPTKRLNELTLEIRTTQLWTGKKIGALRSHLANVISNIREARDPKKIETEKGEKKKFEDEYKRKDQLIKSWKETLENTRGYAGIRFYEEYKEREKIIAESIKGRQKDGAKQRKEKKQTTEEINSLYKELQDNIGAIQQCYFDVTPTLRTFLGNKEKNHLSLWEDVNIKEEIANPEIHQVLKFEASNFREILSGLHKKESQNANVREAQVYRELIDILDGYENIHIKVPGFDIIIGNLVESLREEAKKHVDLIAKTETLASGICDLDKILETRRFIVDDLLIRYKKALEKDDESSWVPDTSEELEFERINNSLSECRKKIEYYKAECAKSGILEKDIPDIYNSLIRGKATDDIKNLENYNEDSIKERIYHLEDDIATENKVLIKIKSNIEFLNKEIERLERKEEHPYQENLKYLEDVLSKIQRIEVKLNIYDGYINELINKRLDKNIIKSASDGKEKLQYYEHVFIHLGKRLDTIRHIDAEYKVDKIDLIDSEIITKDGKVIKISDMGTGQSQSAYLKGLLSLNDGRKLIALFDEVAMMDQESLKPIYTLLKGLYDANKLLLGVIVQKAEMMKVMPIE